MIAFHGKVDIKNKYLFRVKRHRELDNLVQGVMWENGKGCAVGCTLETYDHAQYEIELGIPEWLAHLEDMIFEGLTKERAMLWPEQFLSAIKPGANLDETKTPFLIYVLESCLESMDKAEFDKAKHLDVVKVIKGSKAAVLEMIRCHKEGLDTNAAKSAALSAETAACAASAARCAESNAARNAEWSAAWSAACAARCAARCAESNAARNAEWSAACAALSAETAACAASAARCAESNAAWNAAWNAASAARCAARCAESNAACAARCAACEKFANKLLQLFSSLEGK